MEVNGIRIHFSCHLPARRAAVEYCLSAGISPSLLPRKYVKIDRTFARKVATLYEELEASPGDPITQACYRALAEETLAQWQVIKRTGLRVEYNPTTKGEPDPYSNPRRAILDVIQNNHLFVTETRSAHGSDGFHFNPANPLLFEVPSERISGRIPLVNDFLRVVHDYFGHTMEGLGFRPDGEFNAWRCHLAMCSRLARRAMTMEMLGQNCWINFGPHGDKNRYATTENTL